jgi:TetR/AcrR family transcriptional repressor of lmrAB and yxaGH operons
MRMAGDTKQRMVEAAAELLRVQGLASTSFTDVLATSGAARGVIYHHFPGGKAELARDAVVWTGKSVQAHLAAIDVDSPSAVVAAFLALVRPVVEQSAHGASCAVAAVVNESGQIDAELTTVSETALQSWVDELDAQLRRTGAKPAAAQVLSTLMITFLEGSHVLCRAAGTLEPFDRGALGVSAAARDLLG